MHVILIKMHTQSCKETLAILAVLNNMNTFDRLKQILARVSAIEVKYLLYSDNTVFSEVDEPVLPGPSRQSTPKVCGFICISCLSSAYFHLLMD